MREPRDDLTSSAVAIGTDLWPPATLSGMQLGISSSARRTGACCRPDWPCRFSPGAGYADRAHDEAHRSFLMCEHVLDHAADFGFLRVGDTHALRHRSAWRLLAMDARHEPAPRQHRFVLRRPVGCVRPDVARRV
jgi:hypothetical protein